MKLPLENANELQIAGCKVFGTEIKHKTAFIFTLGFLTLLTEDEFEKLHTELMALENAECEPGPGTTPIFTKADKLYEGIGYLDSYDYEIFCMVVEEIKEIIYE